MPSSQEFADRLVRRLQDRLMEQVGVKRFRLIGGFQFFNLDRPTADEPIALAVAAFEYMAITEEGNWTKDIDIIVALKAFLDLETGIKSEGSDLLELSLILQTQPVSTESLREWFKSVYQPYSEAEDQEHEVED